MNRNDKNYQTLLGEISQLAAACGRHPEEITLVTVSKGHSLEELLQVYNAGCRQFGENRIQEALPKISQAPQDIQWHFIGRLQTNKVRSAIKSFALIHSVDTWELVQKISNCSLEEGIITNILLQVNTSGEESKQGLSIEQWREHFLKVQQLPGVSLQGLMTIAPFTEDQQVIRQCFSRLRDFKEELEQKGMKLPHLSIGMSHDYKIAIEEGATLLRIGTAIFESKKN